MLSVFLFKKKETTECNMIHKNNFLNRTWMDQVSGSDSSVFIQWLATVPTACGLKWKENIIVTSNDVRETNDVLKKMKIKSLNFTLN